MTHMVAVTVTVPTTVAVTVTIHTTVTVTVTVATMVTVTVTTTVTGTITVTAYLKVRKHSSMLMCQSLTVLSIDADSTNWEEDQHSSRTSCLCPW